MSSFSHYGQTLDATNLHAACRQAAQGRPQVPMALFPLDGAQWLTELIVAVQEHPLRDDLARTLRALVDAAEGIDLQILGVVAEEQPGIFDAEGLIAALFRAQTASIETRETLARAVSRQILDGRVSSTEALRVLAEEPKLREALAPAWVVGDHAWAMQQIEDWFHGEPDRDRWLLLSIVSVFTRGELVAIAEEMAGEGDVDPNSAAGQIIAYATEFADNEHFVALGDRVRWRAS